MNYALGIEDILYKMIAETKRLILRKFKKSDVSTFLLYRRDMEVAKFQSWNTKITEFQANEFVAEQETLEFGKLDTWVQIAFEEKITNTHIGDCAIRVFDEGRQATIGITIARKYWRKGFAQEGLTGLINIAFTRLKLHRIVALVDVENIRSIKLLESLGMRREAHFIQSYFDVDKQIWKDEFSYGILDSQWI